MPFVRLTAEQMIFQEGTFIPTAKLTEKESFSIITDHLGTPYQNLSAHWRMYDTAGKKTWKAELDIYGKVRNLASGSFS